MCLVGPVVHTAVVKMLAHLHVTVASRRNVEVTLNLVALHASVDPATIRIAMSGNLGSLGPLLRGFGRAEIVVYVLLLVFSKAWVTLEI